MGYHDYKKDYKNYGNYLGYGNSENDRVVSVGAWIGILILMAIPFLDIIGLLIMAFGNGNENIKNFAKASLLLIAIPFTLIVLLKGCS